MIALFALLACDPSPPPAASAPLAIQADVARTDVPSGESVSLTVEVFATEGAQLQLQPPAAEGLTVTPTGQEGPLPAGSGLRQVFSYTLDGDDGSYIIQPGAVATDGSDEPIVAPPIFVDIGVEGPSGGEMAGFASAPPQQPPWMWIGLGAGVALFAAAALGAYLLRPRTPAAPEPPEPRARRRWAAARKEGLDDPALAVVLSGIFRDYLQERHGFPAQANTSREIIASLSSRKLVSSASRETLSRVLEASDRLKYGRDGGGPAFFDDLEAAFEQTLRAGQGSDDA